MISLAYSPAAIAHCARPSNIVLTKLCISLAPFNEPEICIFALTIKNRAYATQLVYAVM